MASDNPDEGARALLRAGIPATGEVVPRPPRGWPHLETVNDAIDGYDVLEVAGVGAMGTVYRARQSRLGRDVAIKMIRLDVPEAQHLRMRLQREAQIMGSLSHPNVVPVYDVDSNDDFCWIVMEFVDGENLASLLEHSGGSLPPTRCIDIVRQVAEALQHAHGAGIIHRDIKPANLLIDGNLVRVADFGIARYDTLIPSPTADPTLTGVFMGTEAYSAPELLLESGMSEASMQSDLYSLGVVFYRLLTGRLPRGIFKLPSKTIADCPVHLDQVISRCLASETTGRYSDATEFLANLEAPDSSHTPRPTTRTKTFPIPNKHAILLAAGLTTFFIVCFFVGAGDNRFSLYAPTTSKQFHSALALTVITSLFHLLWGGALYRSWRRNHGRVSTGITLGVAAFVMLGIGLITVLAVMD